VTLAAEAVPALITEQLIPRTVAAMSVRVILTRVLAMSSPGVVDISFVIDVASKVTPSMDWVSRMGPLRFSASLLTA
jgi:hypothetical protein